MGLKKKLVATLIGASTLLLVGCGGLKVGDSVYSNRFEVVVEYDYINEVRDRETGVHYFLGYNSDSLCPVYLEDGTVKTTKENPKYVKGNSNE